MSKKKVTESPEELIGKANSDVIAINSKYFDEIIEKYKIIEN